MNSLTIATVADENYALPVTVMLISLFEKNSASSLTVYLMDAGISEVSKKKIENSVSPFLKTNRLIWLSIPLDRIEKLPLGIITSSACWARILLPDLLAANIQRVLYLDSDTVIVGDLSELYCQDFQGKPLLAAYDQNGWIGSKMFQVHNLSDLEIPPESPCFNAGVLLFDLDHWRRESLSEKIFLFATAHPDKMHLPDQNAINLALFGKIGSIDQKWNVQPIHKNIRSGIWSDIPTLPEFIGEAKIYHFLSEEKPWLPNCDVPWKIEFYKIWKKTNWPFPSHLD